MRKFHPFQPDYAPKGDLGLVRCEKSGLVVSLVHLLMFDTNGQRWHYLVALVISLVFLIGSALHSIITGIISFLKEPRL